MGTITYPSQTTSTIATLTQVAQSTTSVVIAGTNSGRKGLTIYNDTGGTMYIRNDGGVASTTQYTTQIPTGTAYVMQPVYIGAITGIWASAGAGTAKVSDFS